MGTFNHDSALLEVLYDKPIEIQKALSLLEKQGFTKNEIVVLKTESLIVRSLRKIFSMATSNFGEQKNRTEEFKIQLVAPHHLTEKIQRTLKKYTRFRKFNINNY